jgi:hypothetical protein
MKPSGIRPLLFLIEALFCAGLFNCAGTPSEEPGTGDRAGPRVFTGVSSAYYLSRDRALTLALRDAARRVSFFHSVEGIIKSSEIYDPQFRIARVDDEKKLVYDTDYEKYIRLLEFDPERDVYTEHGALFVNAVYTGENGGMAVYRRRAGAGKPLWVEYPPVESGGFLCAVGVAGARLSHTDAVIASYEDAVYAFVKNSFSKVYVSQQSDGTTMLANSFALFSGVVKGFHVLETWTDPKSGAVWTLAAAREVIRKMEES